ncbi:MAG TPA: prephenate dehydrogenase [Candidatus Nitrosotalea sp.]|nr:prephenate dehydrogenase [Candidatus Nitrosotalea sp.]
MIVGVAGLGLMGGSFALALRAARPDLELIGEDPDPAAMTQAVAAGAVKPGDILKTDVLFLAVPIPALPALFHRLRGYEGVVTDMASTKVNVMSWAAQGGVRLIGGHPMCGRERSGFAAADGSIFQGAPWVLTQEQALVLELVRAVGARPLIMDAERHDRLAAGASHLAYLVSVAYVLSLAEGSDWPGIAELAGSGFRDVSRLAAGDPELYAAIVTSNRQPVLEALSGLESALQRLRGRLVDNGDGLVQDLRAAKRARDGWADAGPG